MDITYSWLKDYVKFDIDPNKTGDILTNIGLEVEKQADTEAIPGGLKGVVVAKVLECVAHPNSDHLHITKVDRGDGEPLQIVCGAPNVAANQKVMLATLGTHLTLNGQQIVIKKSKIRGVESFGMLCAEDELGVGSDHSGIMVLPEQAKVGTPAKEYFNLKSETSYTIGLTPNRVDAASIMGVARDFSTYLKFNNLGGELTFPSIAAFKEGEQGGGIEVEVKQPGAAPRYSGVTLKNITVKESPKWLKDRLLSIGLRPINNIVDITNFVLMETGNPLHAFDLDKIKGGKIVVDVCPEGTKFTTLDGVERTLSEQDLMICNAVEPMCMAGVFGGLNSGVTDKTTSIFIESAYFNPVSIRKTSKRHTLKTEASFRYERGCDPNMVAYALRRAALLVLELAGGEVVGKVRDIYDPKILQRKEVELNYSRIEDLMGVKIGVENIRRLLEYQDIKIINETSEGCRVTIPTYKVDVYRECDVVEEILRVYGYNNVPLPSGVRCSVNIAEKPDNEEARKDVCRLLSYNGFMEMMNNSLTKSAYYEPLKSFPKEKCVRIFNPLSSDLDSMRQTLLFSGLEVVAYNLNRQENNLKLYELGNVYSYEPSDNTVVTCEASATDEKTIGLGRLRAYKERQKLLLIVTGEGEKYWKRHTVGADYFSLMGYIELILKRFGVDMGELVGEKIQSDIFAEGLTYKLKNSGKELFTVGEISKKILRDFDIKQRVFAAEIGWNVMFGLLKKHQVVFSELPRFPEVKRDLALLVGFDVEFAALRKAAFATEKKLLRRVELFDVYTGDKIPAGKRQYALSFYLQDLDKTLTDKAVEAVMNKLLNVFKTQFNAELR